MVYFLGMAVMWAFTAKMGELEGEKIGFWDSVLVVISWPIALGVIIAHIAHEEE